MTLLKIQEDYIAEINASIARWSHRQQGGHSHRTMSSARRKATRRLIRLGYTDTQIVNIIQDARDMALLEREAER